MRSKDRRCKYPEHLLEGQVGRGDVLLSWGAEVLVSEVSVRTEVSLRSRHQLGCFKKQQGRR